MCVLTGYGLPCGGRRRPHGPLHMALLTGFNVLGLLLEQVELGFSLLAWLDAAGLEIYQRVA
ncbi:MAG: hypothetical protein FD153_1153 [Rhodospirillaceae bacterium]|nr:MAG: hypothetical protein FD153_1153 [Rhodospirillaceae bacterium]